MEWSSIDIDITEPTGHKMPFQLISECFNNERFSDCVIVATNGMRTRSFHCHKFILAINSQEFRDYFFGPDAVQKSIYHAYDIHPTFMNSMINFFYTNEIELQSMEECHIMYDVSRRFEVKSLMQICNLKIIKNHLSLDNLVQTYNYTIREQFPEALEICRSMAQNDTHILLELPSFYQAHPSVLLDILKQDKLQIESEAELARAMYRWCVKECQRRKKIPNVENRNWFLKPFLRYIRILSLREDELYNVIGHLEMIDLKDVLTVTGALLTGRVPDDYPDYLCPIFRKRIQLA